MHLPDPTFPPLLSGRAVTSPNSPWDEALTAAKQKQSGAGDFYWAKNVDRMEFAVVLEPEVSTERCTEILYLGMVAFSDALGSIAPPEVAVTFLWPNIILVNGAIVGTANLLVGKESNHFIPEWLVLGLSVDIRPEAHSIEPGNQLANTCLHLEGCGDLDRTRLTESTARHMVNWIYTWSEDGFKAIHKEWTGRYHEENKMGGLQAVVKSHEKLPGIWVMMDEQGNAIYTAGDGSRQCVQTSELMFQDKGLA